MDATLSAKNGTNLSNEILSLQIGSTVEGKIRDSDPYGTDDGFWAWALFAFDDAA